MTVADSQPQVIDTARQAKCRSIEAAARAPVNTAHHAIVFS
jgi:hypothetical protein